MKRHYDMKGEKNAHLKNSQNYLELLTPFNMNRAISKLLESTGFKYEEKLTSSERVAEEGDVDHQMWMARDAENEHSTAKALHFYMLAALKGNGEAQGNAARILFSMQEDVLALVYLKLGAENEVFPGWQARCQRALAECLEIGKGIPPDPKNAVHYYELAANNHSIDACIRLGQAYLKGELGLEPSPEMAKKYFLIAAIEGNLKAIQHLENLSTSQEKILEFYRKAYLKGIQDALYYAGVYLFKLGQSEKAVRYFIRGTKEKCPFSFQSLGFCLENGLGIRKCLSQAKYYQNLAKCYLKLDQVKDETLVPLKESKANLEIGAEPQTPISICQAFFQSNQDEINDLQIEIEQGDVKAAWRLGCIYLEGKKVPYSFKMAQKYYSKGAELGGAQSQFILGYFYDLGLIELSIPKAIHYYEMSANQGNREAIKELEKIYARRNDMRTIKDFGWASSNAALIINEIHRKILRLKDSEWKNRCRAKILSSLSRYVADANKGNPYVLWEAADLLFEAGRNEEAVLCLMKGVESTDLFIQSECQQQLGWRFRDGKGVQQSDEKAIHYLTLALKNENPIALRFLSEGYFLGKMGLQVSYDLAREYAEKGAKSNDPGCLHLLGLFHAKGDCSLEKSEEQVERYFKRAMDLHFIPAYKSYILHLFSKGGEGNVEKAIDLLGEIAKFIGWGAYQLGWCYERGIGVKQSNAEAYRNYLIAAEAEEPEGKLALARCYREGIGVGKSIDKAEEVEIAFLPISVDLKEPHFQDGLIVSAKEEILKIFQRVQRGSAKAQYLLGKHYQEGKELHYDLNLALEYFKLAAKGGNMDAAYELGKVYEMTLGIPEQSVHYYILAASQNLEAQIRLAVCYATGHGVEKSLKKAQELVDAATLEMEYEKSCWALVDTRILRLLKNYGLEVEDELFQMRFDQIMRSHSFELAFLYENGIGTEPNPELAFQEYSFLAKTHPSLHFDLYRCYVQGIGVEPSFEKAWEHLEKGLVIKKEELNHFISFHVFDFGLNPSEEQIHGYFQKLLTPVFQAAKQGDSRSQYILGWAYKQGICLKEDKEVAFNYFKLAANQNHKNAVNELGTYLLEDKDVPISKEEFIAYFQDLSEKGSEPAHYYLIIKLDEDKKYSDQHNTEDAWTIYQAALYFKKLNSPKGEKRIFNLLKKGAALAHGPSQYELGKAFYNGKGVTRSYQEAFRYFRLAFENGQAHAIFHMRLLDFDSFEKSAKKEAFEFIKSLAEEENRDAFYLLGGFYREGIGTPVSNEKAVELYTLAADKGDFFAKNLIGEAYIDGNMGLTPSIDTGIKYFQSAASLGSHWAIEQLIKLYKSYSTPFSKETALHFYEQAKKNHNEYLYYLAGLCWQLLNEQEKAFECFSLSANQEYDQALYQVAKALENGLGVKKSPEKAFQIYQRLYENNFWEARKDVERCQREGIGAKKVEGDAVNF